MSLVPQSDVALLAISAELSGHSLSIWKIPVDAGHQLRSIIEFWAKAHHESHRTWALGELPCDVRVTAGPGGQELNLKWSLKTIRPLLPVTGAGLSVTLIWPAALDEKHSPGASKRAHSGSSLGKLRISTRYANVSRDASGFHKSSTQQGKIDAGAYKDTSGKFSQQEFIEAMRTPSLPSVPSVFPVSASGEELLTTRVLVVMDRKGSEGAMKELFRVSLKGPTSLVANWEATCDKFDRKDFATKRMPFPVFIPTHRRAQKANLNWNADHVYGAQGKEGKLQPVVCIVVEAQQEEEYREAWPHALMLVLPENARGPGFARWVVQKTCTRALVRPALPKDDRPLPEMSSWTVRRLPWVWIADDGLSMFYRLSVGAAPTLGSVGNAGIQRHTQREAPEGRPMFRDAFVTVQGHAQLNQMAVAGFLRDDGTAVCKRLEWKANELALYKVVLLNLGLLRRLKAEYQPDLQMYEDICLIHEVLKSGGQTLKCQSYCFRASHVKAGGCSEQRVQRTGTYLDDLIAPSALKRLPAGRQKAVTDLLTWCQSKEQKFGNNLDQLQLAKKPVVSKPQRQSATKSTKLGKRKAEKKPPKAAKKARKCLSSSSSSSSSSGSSSDDKASPVVVPSSIAPACEAES
jgi:hypothetical protein